MDDRLFIRGADPPVGRDTGPARRERLRSAIADSGGNMGDRVTLSTGLKQAAGMRQELSAADRAQVLRELKQKVDAGAYHPDVHELARILTRVIDPSG